MTDLAVHLEARARELLFDYLVVAERGAGTGAARSARAAVDGHSAADAAFLDGVAAHSIELDDTYERASLHPGVVVWPAVLAVADEFGLTLGAVLAAGSTGYDAVCALGDRLDPGETYRRGFHPTGVCGPIGAAAAVSELLELDADQARHARGIAASMASGLMEFLADGAWTKPLHAGQAAANGVRAARLAGAGYTGPADAIGGRHGFLQAFGGRSDVVPPLAPGDGLVRTAVKHYPCCRYQHGCLDLLLELAVEEELEPGDVTLIRCGVLSGGWSLVAEPPAAEQHIRGQVDAQFSMAYGAALALTHHRAGLDDFERASEIAPGLMPLLRRVECFRSERLDAAYPGAWGAEVEVHTRGGCVLTRAEDHFRGSAERPTRAAELLEKAAGLVGRARAEVLLRACLDTPADAALADLRHTAAQ